MNNRSSIVNCAFIVVCILLCFLEGLNTVVSDCTTTSVGNGAIRTTSLGQFKQSITNNQFFQVVSSNESIVAITMRTSDSTTSSYSSVKEMLGGKRIILFIPNSNIYSAPEQKVKVIESSFTTLLEMYNISTTAPNSTSHNILKVQSILSAIRINSDCAFGSIFLDYWSSNEEGPIIITTDWELPKVLRLMRSNHRLGRYLQMEDVIVERLAPLFFSYSSVNVSTDQNVASCVMDRYRNFTATCERMIQGCREEMSGKDTTAYHTTCYWEHDYCILRSSTIAPNSTSSEYSNFLHYLQRSHPRATLYINETLTSTVFTTDQTPSFMKSEVYECASSSCAFEPVTYEQMQGVFSLFFGCLYYIGLLLTFKTKSIRIRLAVPYICPLFVVMRIIFQSSFFASNCLRLYSGIANAVVFYPVVQYIIILFRYFYLRNLFTIISKSDNFKFYKFLALKWFGLVLSLTVPVIFTGLSFLMTVDKEVYLTSNIGFFRNGPLGVILVLGIGLGIISLIFDMIGNRKKIKKKGLFYYFFFDDPFYIKIDMLCMGLLFILTILTFVMYNNYFALNALTVGFCVMSYLILGGNSMIIEIYFKIRRMLKKEEGKTKEKSIESVLDDVHLMKLLKKFAMKEFSIENVMIFETLKSIENKKGNNDSSKSTTVGAFNDSLSTTDSRASQTFSTAPMLNVESTVQSYMSLEQACQIEELYIRTYSKFEINFPHQTRKEFYKWLEEKKQQCGTSPTVNNIAYSELKTILMSEVLKNVFDTYSRLEQTLEYKKWLKLTELQKENELYDN